MSTKLDVELDLLEKYDTTGPRYTSYPPATKFNDSIGSDDVCRSLRQLGSDENEPISLYLHIPFCPKLCYFCGCHTVITRKRGRIERYLTDLYREIETIADLLDDGVTVDQLHWGGGTPSYLTPDQIRNLMNRLTETFSFTDTAEIGVEVNPNGLTYDHVRAFSDAGVNRMSVGVQDVNPDVQEIINREQTEAETRRAVTWARRRGINALNVDLIYGLPLQTLASFDRTLNRVIDLDPDRLAVYSYAHVPWMKKHQQAIPEDTLPDPRTKLQLLKTSVETLTTAGYQFIGMDHFAKPDDELSRAQRNGTLQRNFQGYSTRAGLDLIGLGPSGISHLQGIYAQNLKALENYRERLQNDRPATARGYRLTAEDRLRKHVIMELMCNLDLNKRQVESRFGIDFDSHFSAATSRLEAFEKDGLVSQTNDRIRVTSEGRLVIRNICMAFDAYVSSDRSSNSSPTYSRTV